MRSTAGWDIFFCLEAARMYLLSPELKQVKMVVALILLCTFGVVVGQENELKCLRCFSDMNWDQCDDWTETDCLGDQNRCGKIYYAREKLQVFRRGCFTSDFCEKKTFCKYMNICRVECCQGNLCNKGEIAVTTTQD